jgi:hypothetical protein
MRSIWRSWMDHPILQHVRRNHALEHATIHLLSARFPDRTFIGRSDARGFYIYGSISTETLRSAIDQALARLQAGESHLAIHPNCGTNIVTSGFLAGSAAFLSLSGGWSEERWSERVDRLLLAILTSTLALIVSRPLGVLLQKRVTTLAQPGDLQVVSIRRRVQGRSTIHRVITRP